MQPYKSIIRFQVIMDPNLDWDKTFLSPSCSKISKSTLEDKATFWKAPSLTHQNNTKTSAARSTQCMSGETSSSNTVKPKTKSSEVRNKKANTITSKTKLRRGGPKTITLFFNQNEFNDDAAIQNKINCDPAAGIAAEILLGNSRVEEKENVSN